MDRVMLLEELKAVTEDAVKDLIMPVKIQSENEEQQYRAAEVYLMRLPDGSAAKKKAPYIIHQAITSKDTQPSGELEAGVAVVRSIFAVYNDDEQEGGLMLLNLMERLRIRLLREVVIGRRFQNGGGEWNADAAHATGSVLIGIGNFSCQCSCGIGGERELDLSRNACGHIADVLHLARAVKVTDQCR